MIMSYETIRIIMTKIHMTHIYDHVGVPSGEWWTSETWSDT